MEPTPFTNSLDEVDGKFELLELIGEGTYGEVYRGYNKAKFEVAIKVVGNTPNKHDEIQTEMIIFQKYSKHPNLVDYYGTYLYRNESGILSHIWLVMEYCGGRSVSHLAKTTVNNGNSLSENIVKLILQQTLSAMKYLHSNHIIHRDIKGPNVLLTKKGHVKLIDFGVSAQLNSTLARRYSSVGSPFWMAPEVIACEQQLDYNYDNRCDVWSLGIMAIELADGDPPLSEEHPMRALFKIPRNPPPTVKAPKKWSDEFMQFIARALTKDFETRPTAVELLNDKYLQGIYLSHNDTRKELMSVLHIINKRFTLISSAGGGDQTLKNRKENAKRNKRVLEANDLAQLPRLSDTIILEYLVERYDADQIYTYIGEILVAVNPFKDLQIYDDGASLLYQETSKETLPPHIFMIACTTHQALIHKQRDQCCVISGESGSGKTVSANYLVHQFAAIGKSNGDKDMNMNLVKKILQVNPLMDAFGNAQTAINQNSSRFGKLLELHFKNNGTLVGAKLSEYLLEKSRVVSQPNGERNFHILYYLVAGLDFQNKLKEFELDTLERHRYLNTDELTLAECACTSEMQLKFSKIQNCFEDIGFTEEDIQSIYCVLAAIIHLGDVEFVIDDMDSYEGEKARTANPHKLEIVSSLLCVDPKLLNEALTTNSSVTRGETIKHNNDIGQAMDCRDATSKALYGRLFSWIVLKINTLLRAEDKTDTINRKIGILDIFGFENFTQNSFEQLCINIANEQMQFYFNEYVFVWELEEYASEEVKGVDIDFKNNKSILDLFLQRPVGLLALLDEESRFPKASDLTLVEKFQDNIQSEYMKTSKETNTLFTIDHYGGKVVYDATGFLEKNRDTLSIDILQLLELSKDKTIATLFQNITGTTRNSPLNTYKPKSDYFKDSEDTRSSLATSRFQQTVAIHFRQSLRILLSKIIRSDPHFVRCIRPNVQNKPNLFDRDKVMKQLKYTGIIEASKIRKLGYSDRISFKEFIKRFRFLLYDGETDVEESPDVCVALLRKANIDEDESWKIGKTKVFLKYWHMEALSKCQENYRLQMKIIGKFVLKIYCKMKIRKSIVLRNEAATKIRAAWLCYITRRNYLEKLEGANPESKKEKKRKPSKPALHAEHASADRDASLPRHSSPTENGNISRQESLENTSIIKRKFSAQHNFSNKIQHIDLIEDASSNMRKQVKFHEKKSEVGNDRNANRLFTSEENIDGFNEYRYSGSSGDESDESIVHRPHYKNMKRVREGYGDENLTSDDESEAARDLYQRKRSIMNTEMSEALPFAEDKDGQAALEETRSIILLSQIDLASKETYEMLNKTSYPVILSMEPKASKSKKENMKNQKLNHKERMLAVVDGYGNPLKQKYRQARLHHAVAPKTNDEERNSHKVDNAPMLGLVEKPTRDKALPMYSEEMVSKTMHTNSSPINKAYHNGGSMHSKRTASQKMMADILNSGLKDSRKTSTLVDSFEERSKPYVRNFGKSVTPKKISNGDGLFQKKNPSSHGHHNEYKYNMEGSRFAKNYSPLSTDSFATSMSQHMNTHSVNGYVPSVPPKHAAIHLSPNNLKQKNGNLHHVPLQNEIGIRQSQQSKYSRKTHEDRLPNSPSPTERIEPRPKSPPYHQLMSAQQKVLQERELIEARLREVERKRAEKKIHEGGGNQYNHPKYRASLPYTKIEDHKPYNYLSNDRTDPRKILGHETNRPNLAKKSSHTLSRNAVGARKHTPNGSATASHRNKKNISGDEDYASVKEVSNSNWSANNSGKKKKHQGGFNYGLHHDSALHSIKLNKTGRLQQLLVK